MNLNEILHKAQHSVKLNSPTILTGLGVSGIITTAYLAHQAGYKSAKFVMVMESTGGTADDRKQRLKERAKLTWKFHIPAAVAGAVAIGCVVGASRIQDRRGAALAAAYSVSERAFSEYRDKITEKLGVGKEQAARDEIATDSVTRNPPTPTEVLEGGPGNVLCCEMYTGRYFHSDMEALRKAQNDLNARLLRHGYASMDDFYHLVGLGNTTMSNEMGWTANQPLELRYSTVLAPGGRPCLTFQYNYVRPDI